MPTPRAGIVRNLLRGAAALATCLAAWLLVHLALGALEGKGVGQAVEDWTVVLSFLLAWLLCYGLYRVFRRAYRFVSARQSARSPG